MTALLIGGTGFTGSHVAPRLLDAGHEVTCLVRATSDRSLLADSRLHFVEGNLDDEASLRRAMTGHDLLVCVASLGFGHASALVAAARASSIRRALFISTTAIFTSLNARSRTVRMAAEETIRESDLQYTILRPTMIYGSVRDRNMIRLIHYLRRWPVLPIIGSGNHLQQPIHVDDVARAVVSALLSEATIGRAYQIAGGVPLSFNDVVDTISGFLGRRVWKLHLPPAPIVAVLRGLEWMNLRLPVRAEQILRLNEDKAFSTEEAQHDFAFTSRTFADGIASEIKGLQLPA